MPLFVPVFPIILAAVAIVFIVIELLRGLFTDRRRLIGPILVGLAAAALCYALSTNMIATPEMLSCAALHAPLFIVVLGLLAIILLVFELLRGLLTRHRDHLVVPLVGVAVAAGLTFATLSNMLGAGVKESVAGFACCLSAQACEVGAPDLGGSTGDESDSQ